MQVSLHATSAFDRDLGQIHAAINRGHDSMPAIFNETRVVEARHIANKLFLPNVKHGRISLNLPVTIDDPIAYLPNPLLREDVEITVKRSKYYDYEGSYEGEFAALCKTSGIILNSFIALLPIERITKKNKQKHYVVPVAIFQESDIINSFSDFPIGTSVVHEITHVAQCFRTPSLELTQFDSNAQVCEVTDPNDLVYKARREIEAYMTNLATSQLALSNVQTASWTESNQFIAFLSQGSPVGFILDLLGGKFSTNILDISAQAAEEMQKVGII